MNNPNPVNSCLVFSYETPQLVLYIMLKFIFTNFVRIFQKHCAGTSTHRKGTLIESILKYRWTNQNSIWQSWPWNRPIAEATCCNWFRVDQWIPDIGWYEINEDILVNIQILVEIIFRFPHPNEDEKKCLMLFINIYIFIIFDISFPSVKYRWYTSSFWEKLILVKLFMLHLWGWIGGIISVTLRYVAFW